MCTLLVPNIIFYINRLNTHPPYHRFIKSGRFRRWWSITCRVHHIFQLPPQGREHNRLHIDSGRYFRQLCQPDDKIPQQKANNPVQVCICVITNNVYRELFWCVSELIFTEFNNLWYNISTVDDIVTKD